MPSASRHRFPPVPLVSGSRPHRATRWSPRKASRTAGQAHPEQNTVRPLSPLLRYHKAVTVDPALPSVCVKSDENVTGDGVFRVVPSNDNVTEASVSFLRSSGAGAGRGPCVAVVGLWIGGQVRRAAHLSTASVPESQWATGPNRLTSPRIAFGSSHSVSMI